MYPAVPTCVYRLYDALGRLLYVGVACDLDVRMGQHEKEKLWWPQVARRDVSWFATRLLAMYEEARAIRTEGPIHNVRRGLHPIGLMVIDRRRSKDGSGSYHDDGQLIVSRFDKALIAREVFRGNASALVAVEARPAGMLMSFGDYQASCEAMGEIPALDTACQIELEEIVG